MLFMSVWLVFIYTSGVILIESWSYFTEGNSHGFIVEKGALAQNSLWTTNLYIHVAGGLLCLASCLLQFFPSIRRNALWLHRWLGRIYVGSILLIICPTGLYLGVHAKGGAWGQSGFILLGILTFVTTWKGAWAARTQSLDLQAHRAFMIRSFVLVATANTFRIYHLLLQSSPLPYEVVYTVSLWLSLSGNIILGETVIAMLKKTTNNRNHEYNKTALENGSSHATT